MHALSDTDTFDTDVYEFVLKQAKKKYPGVEKFEFRLARREDLAGTPSELTVIGPAPETERGYM